MPRSSSSRPILGRAMAILALPLTPISKAKGPIARNLLLFKKRGRRMSSSSTAYGYEPHRHRHYNYAYVGEYQFSPSRSPLIAYPPGLSSWRKAAKKRRSKARMLLASFLCGGDDLDVAVLDGLRPRHDDPRAAEFAYRDEAEAYDQEEEEVEEDEGVDGRAERFIERFYEEMRMQHQRLL